MKNLLFLLSVAAILIISGCTQPEVLSEYVGGSLDSAFCDCEEDFECSSGECIKTPEKVITEYLSLSSVNSSNEFIENSKVIISEYATGYWKERKGVYLEQAIKIKSEFDDIASSHEIVCVPVFGIEECNKVMSMLVDSFEGVYTKKIQQKSIAKQIIDDNNVKITAGVKIVTPQNVTNDEWVYLLVKHDNAWLIQDSLNDENVKYSISYKIEDISTELEEGLFELLKIYDEYLQKIIEAKGDTCIYLYKEFKDESSEERTSALTQCYQTNYYPKAVYQNDTTICETIFNEYHYALCYVKIAVSRHDCSVCETIENKEYDARIGTLTTKDACYYNCANEILVYSKAEEACEKIADSNFKAKCFKMLPS